jgi:hypothetical protein
MIASLRDFIGANQMMAYLATQDRYQFQWWALTLLPGLPFGGQQGSKTGKKGIVK